MNQMSSIRACHSPEADSHSDEAILAADKRMQRALGVIETRGIFFDCESHSPKEANEHSDAEDMIGRALATTPAGALVKAWIAWSTITNGFTEKNRHFGDIVRRRDLARLEAMSDELDWEHQTMLSLVRSLRQIARTHRVVSEARLDTELAKLGDRVLKMEGMISDAESVLSAISHGGLLDAAPADPKDYDRHSTATQLLSLLDDRIRQHRQMEEDAGTDVSVTLSVLARRLTAA